MCSRGNVRSVTLAALLKDFAGADNVLTCGFDTLDTNELSIQELWADAVSIFVVGEKELYDRFVSRYTAQIGKPPADKIYHIDIGPDVWLAPMHPGLMRAIADKLTEMGILPEPHGPYSDIETYLAANEAAFYRARTVV